MARRPPSVAVAPDDGAVHVVWTARFPDAHGGHANTLNLSTSRDKGQTFQPPVKINDDEKPAAHGMHSMAVAADGRVYVAWLDERNVAPPAAKPKGVGGHHETESNREVFIASSGDGGRTFSPNKRVATEACPCCKTSLLAARDGRVYAGWRQVQPGDFRHIAVASSGDRGATFSDPVIVSDDRWMIAGCPVSGAALADSADGALRVLWYSAGAAGAPGLYWSESRDAGRTFGARQLVAAGEARGTPLLLTDARNEFVALGEEQHGGTARLIAARLSSGEAVRAASHSRLTGAPPAVAAGDHLVIAYVVKAGERRGVWLVRAKACDANRSLECEHQPRCRRAVGWRFAQETSRWCDGLSHTEATEAIRGHREKNFCGVCVIRLQLLVC